MIEYQLTHAQKRHLASLSHAFKKGAGATLTLFHGDDEYFAFDLDGEDSGDLDLKGITEADIEELEELGFLRITQRQRNGIPTVVSFHRVKVNEAVKHDFRFVPRASSQIIRNQVNINENHGIVSTGNRVQITQSVVSSVLPTDVTQDVLNMLSQLLADADKLEGTDDAHTLSIAAKDLENEIKQADANASRLRIRVNNLVTAAKQIAGIGVPVVTLANKVAEAILPYIK